MNNKYLLSDLVSHLQKKGYDAKQADVFVRAFFSCVERALETHEVVKIQSFGQFKLQQVEARQSVDVNTGERVEIKAHAKVSFVPDAALKELVNAPLSHLQAVVLDEMTSSKSSLKNSLEKLSATKLEPVSKEESASKAATAVNVETAVEKKDLVREDETAPLDEVASEEMVSMETKIETKTKMKKQEEKPIFEVRETKKKSTLKKEKVSKKEKASEKEKTSQKAQVAKQEKVSSKSKKKSAWMMVLCLLLIVLLVYAMLSKESNPVQLKKPQATEQLAKAPVATEQVQEAPVAEQSPAQVSTSSTETALKPQQWPTKQEITIAQGQRLTLLALEHYGDKVFWVYIYQANQDRMANPNDLKVGMKIRIPQLPIALINAKSQEAMSRAKALEDKYIKQFQN